MANTKTYAALKNEKHEKFCNFTSAGMSAADAYIAAGYVVKFAGFSPCQWSQIITARYGRIKIG